MVEGMSKIEKNIARIRETITKAAAKSGRNTGDVKIMGVTKTVDDERIMEAIACGITIMGENYVQEAKRKIETMGHDLEWHMIGHLQSNKAKYAVRLFDMIHSVDRLGLAKELDKRAKGSGAIMKVLIEVNTGGEETKSGVPQDEAIDLVRAVSRLDNLSVQGLMTMPPWFDSPEDARPYFVKLRDLKNRIVDEAIEGIEMGVLSMGMTDDYGVAVEEGATIVRIGRAIFGERK
ncbi:MAG: YggS family pyridoxal phosphate-dependent enzyme [Deltaproteobacteria bacterium]|jgi:pyridoxal phosphate enzyme (YggS family)|nr:YggS family pyridoxal phosphate-dependent enzyme [Deltaproteobacteria bacterium]MBN2844945.1 YggS family pyridoxal phosphate-dependent enzyme [Deltaproteobacteria bacterium]